MGFGISLIHIIVFISSFLLFQIELIISKIFLPNFGGSFMVWGACMVFFQAMLCLGYKYAQVVLNRWGIKRYRRYHLLLLFLPLLTFPGKHLSLRYATHDVPMVFDVFWQLCLAIGFVFFVLSTMSIIWQVWLAETDLEERKNPYTLFAVSNFGSFAALLSYPFFIEPYFDLIEQQNVWRGLYFTMIALQALALWKIPLSKANNDQGQGCNEKRKEVITGFRKVQWLLFSAGGVMIFMGATNILTMEIAPVPLLWVMPLSLYLLAFVLAFKKNMWGWDWLDRNIHLLMAVGSIHFLYLRSRALPLVFDMVIILGVTFLICLHAQRRLRQLKPDHHTQLPEFYYIISIGGFLGGAIVSWGMPVMFNFLAEYLLAFVVICYANGQKTHQFQKYRIVVFVIMASLMIYFYPLIIERVTVLSILGLMVWGMVLFQVMQYQRYGVVILLFSLICMMTFFEESWSNREIIYKDRNYYGVHIVYHKDAARKYMNGTTVHGLQPLSNKHKSMPTSYYGLKSPVGKILTSKEYKFSNIALLGLGVGTLTTYFDASQTIDIFELDKLVINMAKKYFTYLNHTRGKVKIYVGDARLELEKLGQKKYDLIIVDVFTGDAVPEHLMTQEAFELYRERLTDEGIVLIHASNRYLKLGAPLLGTAHSVGARIAYQQSGGQIPYTAVSTWVAISWNKNIFDELVERQKWILPNEDSYKRAIVWSDKHSSISSIINEVSFKNSFLKWNIPWY